MIPLRTRQYVISPIAVVLTRVQIAFEALSVGLRTSDIELETNLSLKRKVHKGKTRILWSSFGSILARWTLSQF
jgi:hypothetical protein